MRSCCAIGYLRARPHDAVGPDIGANLPGRIACAGERLDIDDLPDPDVEMGKIVVALVVSGMSQSQQLRHT